MLMKRQRPVPILDVVHGLLVMYRAFNVSPTSVSKKIEQGIAYVLSLGNQSDLYPLVSSLDAHRKWMGKAYLVPRSLDDEMAKRNSPLYWGVKSLSYQQKVALARLAYAYQREMGSMIRSTSMKKSEQSKNMPSSAT